MKVKDYVFFAIIVSILISCNIYTYIQCKEGRVIQTFLYKQNKEYGQRIGDLSGVRNCRINELLLNGKKIPTNIKFMDAEKEELNFSDVIKDNMLVLRYSEMHCDVCVDSIVAKLNAYKHMIGQNNMLLLTTTKNSNYIKRFKKMNRISFGVYEMSKSADSVFVDIGMPYLFVYTSERISNMFVPQEDMKLTDEYLRSIVSKYY